VKPGAFAYEAPGDLEGALALLSRYGDEAKVLAGGQSLVPLLNLRLANPAYLVDINRIGELAFVRKQGGTLRIGALTRQAMLERSRVTRASWPIFRDALRFVAHPQIRNRGTVGGSLAHADPAAELPAVLAALDARVRLESAAGERTLGWRDFFVSFLTTALRPDELLTEIEVPALPAGAGTAFVEFARRHGDFGLCGVAAVVVLGDGGHVDRCAIALMAAAPVPVRAEAAEAALAGGSAEASVVDEVAALAVADVEPPSDIHGSSGYRKRVLSALVREAVVSAAGRAGVTAE
jgi:CO/xanthine dehydrogenase FAD-binding subunit